MSNIKYTQEVQAMLEKARAEAVKYSLRDGDRRAYELGALTHDFMKLARTAEYDSSLSRITSRIAFEAEFDLLEAYEIVDALMAGIKRQFGDMPDVSVHLGDAAQALYEAHEIQQEPADLFESMGMDRPQFPTLEAA